MKKLSNTQIATLISEKLFGPSLDETEFAFQLFVEKMVCPKNCIGWSKEQMRTWILFKLNGKQKE